MLHFLAYVIAGLSVAVLCVAWALSPGTPKPIVDEAGTVVPGSISEKRFVDINGVAQGMFIVGRNTQNPVLLVLHGGLPEYFLAERYATGLEDLFTVVWWEQRGAGISYSADIPKESITEAQLIADTVAVTQYLRDRFAKERIYLMAHSGGTFFGIQVAAQHPELYHAYIGVAQYADQMRSEKLAYDYMLGELEHLGDAEMVRSLRASPVDMTSGTPREYLAVRDIAMHKLGIGTMRNMRSIITGLFLPSLSFRGYTVREKLRFWIGKARNGVSVLWDASLHVDMSEQVPELTIPVYFFEGAYDYTCNSSLAEAYFHKLRAKVKGLYRFERSAHSPHFEEPERFLQIMRADVLTSSNALADAH